MGKRIPATTPNHTNFPCFLRNPVVIHHPTRKYFMRNSGYEDRVKAIIERTTKVTDKTIVAMKRNRSAPRFALYELKELPKANDPEDSRWSITMPITKMETIICMTIIGV